MKIIINTILLLFSVSTYSMTGSDPAVQSYLNSEFIQVDSVGELYYLGPKASCDEVVVAYVVGDMGSGQTAYSCNICLINEGGIAVVETQESGCFRDN